MDDALTAEGLLKTQTVGLTTNEEFKRKRAVAERQSRQESEVPGGLDIIERAKKKKKKSKASTKLSFPVEPDGELDASSSVEAVKESTASASRIRPNRALITPKVLTKAALKSENEAREALRKDYLALQERQKAQELVIPFVFFDGADRPAGSCSVKRGDFIWVFLDRARKLGAKMEAPGDKSRKDWARVSVDDLMLVRDELIIPHHYTFHHFLVGESRGYHGQLFTLEHTSAMEEEEPAQASRISLGGPDILTKVVDRRWFERNKHIFPASTWEEFDPSKDYANTVRRDAQGNVFFKS